MRVGSANVLELSTAVIQSRLSKPGLIDVAAKPMHKETVLFQLSISIRVQNTGLSKDTCYPSLCFEINLYGGLALGCLSGAEVEISLRRMSRYIRSVHS